MNPLMPNLDDYMTSVNQWGETMGPMVVKAMILLVVLLFVTKLMGRLFGTVLTKMGLPERRAIFVVTGMHILILAIAGLVVLHMLGFEGVLLFRVVVIVILGAMATFIILKPYLPQLPFFKGNTIQTGGMVGKVEAITFLHTKLRTFDGKAVMVPNHKVLNEQVVNFTTNPNRRVDITFYAPLDEDIDKIREVTLDVLEKDERVREKPKPKLVVSKFEPGYMVMQARFWVARTKVITSRWDLNEALKKRFDQEGIRMASLKFQVKGNAAAAGDGF